MIWASRRGGARSSARRNAAGALLSVRWITLNKDRSSSSTRFPVDPTFTRPRSYRASPVRPLGALTSCVSGATGVLRARVRDWEAVGWGSVPGAVVSPTGLEPATRGSGRPGGEIPPGPEIPGFRGDADSTGYRFGYRAMLPASAGAAGGPQMSAYPPETLSRQLRLAVNAPHERSYLEEQDAAHTRNTFSLAHRPGHLLPDGDRRLLGAGLR